MDTAIQGLAIIAALAVAFERILELGRWVMEQRWARSIRPLLDDLTAGRGAVIPAVVFATAIDANLFKALGAKGTQLEFSSVWHLGPGQTREVLGCALMGLALTLGSQFWHDLVKGLTDVRKKLKDARSLDEVRLLTPPVQQPDSPRVVAAA